MATKTANRKTTRKSNGNGGGLTSLAVHERYVLGTARFMEIPTKDLYVDPKYQRDLNEPAIKRMTSGFNLDLFEPPTVNDRSGWEHYKGQRFALIDGQHRKVVAVALRMPTVTCRLVSVPPEKEAELFVLLNRQRLWLTPVQAFKAELLAGNPAAREIAACLSDRGFAVGNPNGNPSIACVAAMKRIYSQGGYAGLGRVVDLANTAWPFDDRQRFSGQILLGLHTFFAKTPRANDQRLADKLAYFTARHILAKGTARWHAWQGLGQNGKSVVDAISDEIGKTYRRR